jgi:hypothetical protein
MVELEENVMINASFLPNAVLAEMVSNLEPNQVIFRGEVVAFYTDENQEEVDFDSYEIIEFNEDCLTVMNTWDIFSKMTLLFGKISIFDGRQKIQTNSKSVNVLGHENIFIEEGAKLEFVTLNALSGPIYR